MWLSIAPESDKGVSASGARDLIGFGALARIDMRMFVMTEQKSISTGWVSWASQSHPPH
jgi:hypothetical protein